MFYPVCRSVLIQFLMQPEAIYCALTKPQLTYVVRQLAHDWTASLYQSKSVSVSSSLL